jgi:hypothetical protein
MKRDFDEVEDLLAKWAEWMRRDEAIVEGYPSEASGGFIPSWRKDTEEMAAAADLRGLESINASVDSLSFMQRRVVYHFHSLGYLVWKFGHADTLYETAKDNFRKIHFSKAK